jgi:hypothetical protein
MRYYLIMLTSLNLFVLLVIIYHEKILNTVDLIQMPINDDLCKHIPFNLSNKLFFFLFANQILMLILIFF